MYKFYYFLSRKIVTKSRKNKSQFQMRTGEELYTI